MEPAPLTVRDASAATVIDFLAPSDATLLHPPPIASPVRPPGV